MATYTTIPTFTSGQVLTSAVMNDVKNNLDLGNAQSAFPYRNLLYNGAMQITQRRAVGSGATGNTTSGFYTVDRFQHVISSLGTWTDTTIAEAPTGQGFRNSFKTECTTADASPAAGDYMLIRQQLEGQDLQRIRKGTASALPLVLTFWVRANVTGTYIVELEDLDNTRSISRAYTISASATWQQVEVTFPADTTGVLDNDNAASMSLNFWLGAGTTYTSGTLATSWGAQTNANRAVGQTNLASATSQYWQITGVQLEVGSVSTPFEFLPFECDLNQCLRYFVSYGGTAAYERIGFGSAISTTGALIYTPFQVPMRTAPNAVASSGNFNVSDGVGGVAATGVTLNTNHSCPTSGWSNWTVASGLTQYRPYGIETNNSTVSRFSFSAEL